MVLREIRKQRLSLALANCPFMKHLDGFLLRGCSSMGEQGLCKAKVAGSSPVISTDLILITDEN
jgi:hypothetical protein